MKLTTTPLQSIMAYRVDMSTRLDFLKKSAKSPVKSCKSPVQLVLGAFAKSPPSWFWGLLLKAQMVLGAFAKSPP